MTRLTSQRGISLMLLIMLITVFAGVAIGVVTLLRARHESYPYQVQSYQAYTLAHAGIEFAIRYASENTDGKGDYATVLQNYFTAAGRKFNFGNGSFTLTYVPGASCGNDAIISRGTSGTATREVRLSHFASFVAQTGASVVKINGPISSPVHYDDCSDSVCYSGSRITFNICDPILATLPSTWGEPFGQIEGLYTVYPTYIAATRDAAGNQITLAGVYAGTDTYGRPGWLWDAACGSCTGPGGTYPGQTLPAWDGDINHGIAQSFPITPVMHSQYAYAHFPTSGNNGVAADRPRKGIPCDPNPGTCCDPNPDTCGGAQPCCTATHPPNPCCYAPQAFAGSMKSYPVGTCIDPTASPTAPTHSGVTWLSRTDFTCSERDFEDNQGHIYVNLHAAGGNIRIETIGDITPPVTFYLHFPYEPADYYPCRFGHDATGVSIGCRSQYPPRYVTWVFTVTN